MFFRSILSLLFPPFCVRCQRIGSWLCRRCLLEIEYCLGPVYFREPRPDLAAAYSLVKYLSPATELVALMKFGNACPEIADWIGEWIAEHIRLPAGAVVTSVPIDLSKRKRRGFNQAERIGRAIAKKSNREYLELLHRRSHTKDQHLNRSVATRQTQNKQEFFCRKIETSPSCIFLVDDVCTTGITLQTCAKAIHQQLVCTIFGITFARD